MYMREFKKMLDRESELRTAYEKGYEKGYAIGYAEGLSEEYYIYVAKELKLRNIAIEMISEITHLTPEQIAQL